MVSRQTYRPRRLESRLASVLFSLMSFTSVITPEANLQPCACGQSLAPKAKFCPECGEPRVQAVDATKPKPRRAAKRQEAAEGREPDAVLPLPLALPAKVLPSKSKAVKSRARTAQTERAKSAKSQTQELQCDEPQGVVSPVDDEPTPAADEKANQAAKREANRAAQRADSQAAYQALKSDIIDARRKALSTLTGVSTVAMP